MQTTRTSVRRYKADLRRLERAKELFLKMGTGDISPDSFERAIRRAVAPGVYEHWKSGPGKPRFYAVMGVAPDLNGKNVPVVTYAPLYRPHTGNLVHLSLLDDVDGFLKPIDRHTAEWDYTGPRFVLIRKLNKEEVGRLIEQAAKVARFRGRKNALERIGGIVRNGF